MEIIGNLGTLNKGKIIKLYELGRIVGEQNGAYGVAMALSS